MALATYGGSPTDIIGSIGGWTFQHSNAGKIIRSRPGGKQFSTLKQAIRQGLFFNQVGNWQQLIFANQVLWNAFGALYTKENPYGEIKTLTGFNWFTALNCNRLNIGQTVFSAPPAYELPAAVPPFTFYLNSTGIFIDFDSPFTIVNDAYLIYTTPPTRRTSSKQRQLFELTHMINSGAVSSINLKNYWQNTHNIPYPSLSSSYNFQVAVLVVAVRISSGIMSPGLRAIATYTSIAGGIGYMSIGGTFVVS